MTSPGRISRVETALSLAVSEGSKDTGNCLEGIMIGTNIAVGAKRKRNFSKLRLQVRP